MKKLFLLIAAATLGLSAATSAQAGEKFRLCTGNAKLNYYAAGQHLKRHAKDVEVIESKGSLDNLDKVTAGECDGAFVQSDALLVYSQRNAKAISVLQRAGVLYQEQANLLCNRKAYTSARMVDLNSNFTVAIGPDGSGANTTWAAFVAADKARYGKVRTSDLTGTLALSAVADGSEVQCALVITALNAPFLKNEAPKYAGGIVLVATDDRDMTKNAKDNRGNPVYTYGEIPSGTYKGIQPSGMFGSKSVDTIQLDAVFVANRDWISAHTSDFEKIVDGFANAKPDIEKLVQPK
ncbi:TAXI family TRAP transporter solute-binding subunit [Bradyrhizobium pachyrhizi]|uniref:TAXI family TRAP transporter solute-binding subunit n=1 Tax=Bradyrhizobium pachyrhizi TaxID=280333 RepID=UPI0024B2319F|nr:TAXI family TRAP transporter solute-binding subunit [Bradyrhizobium pachyrhizi]WFU52185.1 TAXI family TRAP transporter solute-binding subunit [Bradyrhizobium pachyrhizi]